jgi:RNA polymerase sigma factor (sigma-70 family)
MSMLAPVYRAAGGKLDTADDELVAAVREGDDEALGTLFARYHERVTAYAARIVGDREHAQELVQEAFIAALHGLRRGSEKIEFRPWIYRITRNAAIDHLRARARRGTHVDFDVVDAAGVEPAAIASAAHGPEAAVESRQAIENLQGAFVGLTELHHQLLVMRELEGLSYEKIGKRLGMTRSQVESSLFRARRRLEVEYEELSTGRRCDHVRESIAEQGSRPLGVRDEVRMKRHLSHCAPCRREASRARLALNAA